MSTVYIVQRQGLGSLLGLGGDDDSTSTSTTGTATATNSKSDDVLGLGGLTTVLDGLTTVLNPSQTSETSSTKPTSTSLTSSSSTSASRTSSSATKASSSTVTSTSASSSVTPSSSSSSSLYSSSSASSASSSVSVTLSTSASVTEYTSDGSTHTSTQFVTASASSAAESATAQPVSGSKAFIDNKPLAGFVFGLSGLVGLVIIVLIATFAMRRNRRKKLMEEAVSFDPSYMTNGRDGDSGSLAEKGPEIVDYSNQAGNNTRPPSVGSYTGSYRGPAAYNNPAPPHGAYYDSGQPAYGQQPQGYGGGQSQGYGGGGGYGYGATTFAPPAPPQPSRTPQPVYDGYEPARPPALGDYGKSVASNYLAAPTVSGGLQLPDTFGSPNTQNLHGQNLGTMKIANA